MNASTVLSNMEPNVAFHAATASFALCLTPFVLWRQRRDRLHKTLGYTWVIAMGLTALSSFTISGVGGIGPFSFLHALAILALWTLYFAVRMAIQGNIKGHQSALRNLATFGLGLPMVLNFLPDRTFSRAFFEESPLVGLMMMAVLYIAIVTWRAWTRRNSALKSLLPIRRYPT